MRISKTRIGIVLISIVSFLSVFTGAIETYADEYWFSDTMVQDIGQIPRPEEAVNSKISVRDAFNVPGKQQQYALGGTTTTEMMDYYYNGNSTYKIISQQNMVMMYNDSWRGQKGMMWYNVPINLNYAFETESYILVNAKQGTNTIFNSTSQYGASNGLAFVLQNDPQGPKAIGGRGGGIGVFPGYRGSVNMIYNALAVEFDTSSNTGNSTTYKYTSGLDKGLGDKANTSPHMAISSTYVPTTVAGGLSNGVNNINYVWDNFTHDALLQPSAPMTAGTVGSKTATEGDSWLNQWIKLSIKWTPDLAPGVQEGDQTNITTGTLSYKLGDVTNPSTGEVYSYDWQSKSGIDIDQTFNTFNHKDDWDRKVYWGYTGAGSLQADGQFYGTNDYVTQPGNGVYKVDPVYAKPAALMVTKLPFEPDVDINRNVKNITAGDADYRNTTTAKVGDIVEYKIDMKNNIMDQSKLPFSKFQMQDDLKSNEYVEGSFNFTSPDHTGPTGKVVTNSSGNKFFSVGLDSYDPKDLSGTDAQKEAEINKYAYQPGESFTYTYQVKIGNDTTRFDNNVNVSSGYTSDANYGDTSVIVTPENLAMNKTVSEANPIVGETITYSLETTVDSGRLLVDSITDSLPEGMELVSNSTKIYNKKDLGPITALNDADVWNGSNLTIANPGAYVINGGSIEDDTLIVEYQVKPKDTIKGTVITSPKGKIAGTNDYVDASDKQEFSVESNTVDVKVKTDVTVNFVNSDGTDIDPSWIISTDKNFNGKNPAVIYLNTGDSYDYIATIKGISDSIFTNHVLTQTKIEGDVSSTSIAAEGAVIDVTYSAKSSLVVAFVDENGVALEPAASFEGVIGSKIDVKNDTGVKEKIDKILANHYVLDESPTNDTAIEISGTPKTVQYKFKGTIYLSSSPEKLNFGIKENSAKGNRVDEVTFDEALVVSDNRATKSKWTLAAKVVEDFTAMDGSGKTLSGILRYNDGSTQEKNFPLNQDQVLISATNQVATTDYRVSDLWSKEGQGFKLDIPGDYVKKIGKYQAKIVYTLSATP